MALINIELPLEKVYVDLINQYIQIMSILVIYYLLEKTEKLDMMKLVFYVLLGILFNKLVLNEIIEIN